MEKIPKSSPVIFTVGHSIRPLDEFVSILRSFDVERLVDIRTIPRSRHNPQFNRETLSKFLRNRRIGYRHMKALGGLRHPKPDSSNMAWRNSSFRGFADYMQTPAFDNALKKLIALAKEKPTAIMCAESVPWQCHRSLIADALVVREISVYHIFASQKAELHTLSKMAKVHSFRVSYPANA